MRTLDRKSDKARQTAHDPLITQDKFNALVDDLKRLKAKRPHAAAEVARLAELGDFSENVEYQLAKGRLRGINNAILKLEFQINHAEVIKPSQRSDRVAIGHTVTVEADGVQKTFHILGSTETDPSRGIISHNSPIGAALLGHRVGDIVTIALPQKTLTYSIMSIQ